jgi:hypothetical protein
MVGFPVIELSTPQDLELDKESMEASALIGICAGTPGCHAEGSEPLSNARRRAHRLAPFPSRKPSTLSQPTFQFCTLCDQSKYQSKYHARGKTVKHVSQFEAGFRADKENLLTWQLCLASNQPVKRTFFPS